MQFLSPFALFAPLSGAAFAAPAVNRGATTGFSDPASPHATATTSTQLKPPSTSAKPASSFAFSKDAEAVLALLHTLKSDPSGQGKYQLSADGLVRSYAGNGTVIDYVALSSLQLRAWGASLPPMMQEYRARSGTPPERLRPASPKPSSSYPSAGTRAIPVPPSSTPAPSSVAKATTRDPRGLPQSRNELYGVKQSLEGRTLQCYQIWCTNEFDCQLWRYCYACFFSLSPLVFGDLGFCLQS